MDIGSMMQAVNQGIFGTINAGIDIANYVRQNRVYKENQAWNQKLFDYTKEENEITRQREDTAMQRAVADAKLAGINTAALAPNVSMGGASQGGISQANMLEAPQMQHIEMPDIQKIMERAQKMKMNENEEQRKWDKHDIEMIEKAETIEDLKQSKKAREIANRMAERMEEDKVSMETMRKEIMEIEKAIKTNEKIISENTIDKMRKYGIAPNDTQAIKHAKIMAASKHLNSFDGTEQDFINEYKRLSENQFLDEFLERMEKSDVPFLSQMATFMRTRMPRGYKFGPQDY